jgi:hypothetical protein
VKFVIEQITPLGNNFYSSSKKFSKKIFKKKFEKKSKKLLVKRYDEDTTRLLVTRLVILSNISFFIISVFINHAIFAYPSFFKALHRLRGVWTGELEAKKKTKICKFSSFRFFSKKILLYGKKNLRQTSSEPMFTTFGLTKLIC